MNEPDLQVLVWMIVKHVERIKNMLPKERFRMIPLTYIWKTERRVVRIHT